MTLGLSINFDGNCREAVTFYAGVLGMPVPPMLTYGEGDTSRDPNFTVSEAMMDRIMHTQLDIGGVQVACSDMPDAFDFRRGNSEYLTLELESGEHAKAVFAALGEGGTVFVPLCEIPGQGWYGGVVDRFGVGWIVRA